MATPPPYTVDFLESTDWIIFKCQAGSIAYGTSTPTSDVDYRGVYIQPLEDILGLGYVPQVNNANNDTIYYELRRFLELLAEGSPNMVELLAVRRGEVSLDALIDWAEQELPVVDALFEQAELPLEVTWQQVDQLLRLLRFSFYARVQHEKVSA